MKVVFYCRISKKLQKRPVKYTQDEIIKFDKSLPMRKWLKLELSKCNGGTK